MMHLCRELFPTILEQKGKLFETMKNSFAYSKTLYEDIMNNEKKNEFEGYILKQIDQKQEFLTITNKTPEELIKEVGYKLYECKDERQTHLFRKYYTNDERLCTFKGKRLESSFVFFAVKENAEKLKREDFKKPMREDEYGTSVISIQFTRNNHTLSIITRYNHTVKNPNATFGNNLENIIPGLTYSFEKVYGLKINQQNKSDLEIPGYINVKGKLYKYNYEINNIYYCPNNVIIKDGKIYQLKPEEFIVMDYFILNKKEKRIELFDKSIKDGFINEYKDIVSIKEKKDGNKKTIIIKTKEGHESSITLNRQNQIIEYKNNYVETLENNFLTHNRTINQLELNSVKTIKDNCFSKNEELEYLNIQNAITIGKRFFGQNNKLKKLYIPNARYINEGSFEKNTTISVLDIKNIIEIGDNCFANNESLRYFYAPKLRKMGNYCFRWNENQECINISSIEEIGYSCFSKNKKLKYLYIPKIKKIESDCFRYSPFEVIYAPVLIECKSSTVNKIYSKQKNKTLTI